MSWPSSAAAPFFPTMGLESISPLISEGRSTSTKYSVRSTLYAHLPAAVPHSTPYSVLPRSYCPAQYKLSSCTMTSYNSASRWYEWKNYSLIQRHLAYGISRLPRWPPYLARALGVSIFNGSMFQISSAYSLMQRSLLKKPMRATLRIVFFTQLSWSRYALSTSACVSM